jgi:hypothetical protein
LTNSDDLAPLAVLAAVCAALAAMAGESGSAVMWCLEAVSVAVGG